MVDNPDIALDHCHHFQCTRQIEISIQSCEGYQNQVSCIYQVRYIDKPCHGVVARLHMDTWLLEPDISHLRALWGLS